ncbi:MAG: universal stress protein [Spirochaetes bacterium]|nr:universal stress protein [Spirochaetota bacterium]
MSYNYLTAVDSSEASMKIANYLVKILRKEDKITLYSVLPNPTIIYNLNEPTAIPLFAENKDVFSIFEKSKKDEMKTVTDNIIKILKDAGFKKDNITVKLETQKETTAHQIADEAVQGKYDTIVMGKHNSSIISEFFMGSVTNKVIHLSKNIPVIVV